MKAFTEHRPVIDTSLHIEYEYNSSNRSDTSEAHMHTHTCIYKRTYVHTYTNILSTYIHTQQPSENHFLEFRAGVGLKTSKSVRLASLFFFFDCVILCHTSYISYVYEKVQTLILQDCTTSRPRI